MVYSVMEMWLSELPANALRPNKSLDASGGGVFRNLLGPVTRA
jgi:hypothetical protein